MNKSTTSFLFSLFMGAGFFLLCGCSGASRSMPSTDLFSLMNQGNTPILVDVRSAGEFAAGHLPGAIHIPFYAVGKRSQEISTAKDRPVVVYCTHGLRAWWAAFVLRGKGFSEVAILSLRGSNAALPVVHD
ncbi:MAG: rhodanese-like domain-containing protein [Proteobacteria bacterium]|nr:rhodanese-like domain-containing protein [Pseudomonadota bacterium]MBU1641223.1 rhodanese-like domain-containing protein [Pseudomonadota bacterium]